VTAAPCFSPARWFTGGSGGGGAEEAPLPPFAAAWCSRRALECGALRALVLCATDVEHRLDTSDRIATKARFPVADALRSRLHLLAVAGCLRSESPAHAESELCAAAAGAAALARMSGAATSFRTLVADLLLACPGAEALALPPVAAAAEVWPAALRGGGKHGTGGKSGEALLELLRYASAQGGDAGAPAAAAPPQPLLLGRRQGPRAASFLRELGVRHWGWPARATAKGKVTDAGADRHRKSLARLAKRAVA
jgi:hypothetical protein